MQAEGAYPESVLAGSGRQECGTASCTSQHIICAERGCASGRRVRLDLTLDGPASPATRLSLAEARAVLGAVGLGPACRLGRPSQWSSPTGGSAAGRDLSSALTRVSIPYPGHGR